MTKSGKFLVALIIIAVGVGVYFNFFADGSKEEQEAPPALRIGSATFKGSVQDVFYRFGDDHDAKYADIAQKFQTAGKQQTALNQGMNYLHLDEATFTVLGGNAADGIGLDKLLNCVSDQADGLLFVSYKSGKWNGYKGPLGLEIVTIADPAAYKVYAGEGFVMYASKPSAAYCVKSVSVKAGLRLDLLVDGWNLIVANEQDVVHFRSLYPGVKSVWYLNDISQPQPFNRLAKNENISLNKYYLLWVKVDHSVVAAAQPTKEQIRSAYVLAYCDAGSSGLLTPEGFPTDAAMSVFKNRMGGLGIDLTTVNSFKDFAAAFDVYFDSEVDLYTQDVQNSLVTCVPQLEAFFNPEEEALNEVQPPLKDQDDSPSEVGGDYVVILVENGDRKVEVIKALRGLLSLALKDAKELSDKADGDGKVTIKEGLSLEQAKQWEDVLKQAGATVEVEQKVAEVANENLGARNEQLAVDNFKLAFVESACEAVDSGFSVEEISFRNPKFSDLFKDSLVSQNVSFKDDFDFLTYFTENAEEILTREVKGKLTLCGALNL